MYKIKTNERNNQKATEFETKSLLYLLTKVKDHDSVDLFIIDCFNDVTGASSNYQYSWDIQSKGVASLTPHTIGVALYTLFSNYVSDIDFSHYMEKKYVFSNRKNCKDETAIWWFHKKN